MKCLLLYYTGTFNTRYITEKVQAKLEKKGWTVSTYEIDPLKTEVLPLKEYDVVGLGYPIYGFNPPYPFMRFLKAQTFPEGQRVFIYKNSGETLHANDASSSPIVNKLKRDKARIENEYHFIMPYNIHFRFDDELVSEMLSVDALLTDILGEEVTKEIPNIKKYGLIEKLITFFVKIQYLGGPINSFFYRVEKESCTNCNLCIKRCPTQNIYRDKKGRIRFHHRCIMCMRCSLFCPTDSLRIGILEGWRVNGPYNFKKIEDIKNDRDIITEDTEGFFECYIETYESIRTRHEELFGE